MISTVTGKNQISIPAALARKHGVEAGWSVEWREGDAPDELVLRLVPDRKAVARRLHGAGRKLVVPGSDPVADLVGERAAEG
jgi:bifunctional DNA-binding transcriptional regulator/antitoxin component of YhaV-PrlF toxin-antitoxin module